MLHPFRSTLTALLVTTALLASSIPAPADDAAVLRGTVVDFSGEAIKKASVVLTTPDDPSIRLETTTDKIGFFEFAIQDASLSYQASFERRGYLGMSAAIELSGGSVTEHTFTMLTQKEVDEGKAEILAERENPAGFAASNLYNDGVAALSSGDLATARQLFEEALELDASMPQALSALCLVTMEQQEWNDAVEYAKRTLEVDPTDLRALIASYRGNRTLGNDAETAAAADALKAAGFNDEAAGQIFNEGVDLYQQNRIAEATACFEEVVDLDPTRTNANMALAGLYLNEGAFDKALAACDRVLAQDPGNAKALRYRFDACLLSGNDRLPEAIDSLAAVDLPHVSATINRLAFNSFKNNQFEESRKLVEQLLSLNAEDARANYLMGLILVNAGDNETARKHLQAFVDAAPEDPDTEGARTLMEAME